MSRPHPPAYPHGEPQEVLPNVFFLDGSIKVGPMRASRAMTVVREGERLIIINSVRLDDEGLAKLDALGKVTHTIRVGGYHGSDDPFYKEHYGATSLAIAGQTYFTGINPAKGQIYFEPDGYLDATSELPIEGASLTVFSTSVPEALLRLPVGGGTLVAADAMHNWGPDEYFNFAGKLAMRVAGMFKPYRLGGGWLKTHRPDAKEIAGILDIEFDNVLPGHGRAVIGGAKDKYRPHIDEYVSSAS